MKFYDRLRYGCLVFIILVILLSKYAHLHLNAFELLNSFLIFLLMALILDIDSKDAHIRRITNYAGITLIISSWLFELFYVTFGFGVLLIFINNLKHRGIMHNPIILIPVYAILQQGNVIFGMAGVTGFLTHLMLDSL